MENEPVKIVQPAMPMSYSLVANPCKDAVISVKQATEKMHKLLTGLDENELCMLIKDIKSAALFKEYLTTASDLELIVILNLLSKLSSSSISSLLNHPLAHQTLQTVWNLAQKKLVDTERMKFALAVVNILREGYIGAVSLTANAILFVGSVVQFVHKCGENKCRENAKNDDDDEENEKEKVSKMNHSLPNELFHIMQKIISLRVEEQSKEETTTGGTKRALSRSENKTSPHGSPHKSPRKEWKEPLEPFLGYCHDEETLARREKDIWKGKNSEKYEEYARTVPKLKRIEHVHPRTPNKHVAYSRRAWDGLIKQWRIALHGWKEAEEKYNEKLSEQKDNNKKTPSPKKAHKSITGCKMQTNEDLEGINGPPFVCQHCCREFMYRSTLVTHAMAEQPKI